jgi:serine protease inhibitor
MPDITHTPMERSFSFTELGNSLVGVIQERIIRVDKQIKQCVNDYLKTIEEIEADFMSTSLSVRPVYVEQVDRFPFSKSDNLDGYSNTEYPGATISGVMEENY